MRVKCAECALPEGGLDLCLPCLATGREERAAAPRHRKTHAYRVLDNHATMHIFDRAWWRHPHAPARLLTPPATPQPRRHLERRGGAAAA